MPALAADPLLQRLAIVVFAGAIGLVTSWIAWRGGFYSLPSSIHYEKGKVTSLIVFIGFAIFLGIELILIPSIYLVLELLEHGTVALNGFQIDIQDQAIINLISLVCVAISLTAFYTGLSKESQEQVSGVNEKGFFQGRFLNLLIGGGTWLLVYPWIVIISQVTESILQIWHQTTTHVDQVAVKYLKELMIYPLLFLFTILAVIILVPVIEEFLFRGLLQNWLKSFLNRKWAIALTSLVFAGFHFSFSQGIKNIELLSALFVLSCYLGFLREKRNSLSAPIGLHATFNLISVFRILNP